MKFKKKVITRERVLRVYGHVGGSLKPEDEIRRSSLDILAKMTGDLSSIPIHCCHSLQWNCFDMKRKKRG